MTMFAISETTPQERGADLIYRMLVNEFQPTAREVADMYGISERTAQHTMTVLSRAVPLFRDEDTGRWQLLSTTETISLY